MTISVAISRSYLSKILVPAMSPSFADLRIITSASECLQQSNWTLISPTCDPWGRPFNYPSLWVKIFSILGLSQIDTAVIGVLQIFLLSIFFGFWVYLGFRSLSQHRERNSLFVLVILVVLSPPILLLLERGNIDCWIFIGLSLVSFLMISGNFFLPIGLLAFLGALKIYPFAVFPLVIRKLSLSWRLTFIIVAAFGSIISLASEWQIILERSLTTWNSISYGSSIIPLLIFQVLGIEESKLLAALVGWSIFAFLVLILFHLYRARIRSLQVRVQNSLFIEVSLGVFGASFLFSFLVGASYDLRLVLLFPVIVCLFVLTATISQQIALVCTVCFVMYGGQLTSSLGDFGLAISLCSDLVLSIFSAFLFLLIFPNVKEKN